ncbi:MAG: peptide deformylase, partial [bacterium]|nr:peptide deformylase [bacterium]
MSDHSSQGLTIVTSDQSVYQNVLKTKALDVSFPLNEQDQLLISLMKDKLYQLGGVGLAAPQVNESKRIIVIYIPHDAALLREDVISYPMHVLINPSYEPVEGSTIKYDFEACYSVKNLAGKVPRFEQIRVTFFDEEGNYHKVVETGFYARVLQHEIDHINGFLISDLLTSDCIKGTIEEMSMLRREQLPEDKRILFDVLLE